MNNTEAAYILGLNLSTVTADSLKTTYRKLAMKWHPDRNPGDASATENFRKANEAYESLQEYLKYTGERSSTDNKPFAIPENWSNLSHDQVKKLLNDIIENIDSFNVKIVDQRKVNNGQSVIFFIDDSIAFLYIIKPGQQKTCRIGDCDNKLRGPLLNKLFDVCAKKTHYGKNNAYYAKLDYDDNYFIDNLFDMINNPGQYTINTECIEYSIYKNITFHISNGFIIEKGGFADGFTYYINEAPLNIDKQYIFPLLAWVFELYDKGKFKQDKRETWRQKIADTFNNNIHQR